MTRQEAVRDLDLVVEELGTIADELQHGQMIEEDDDLGRRLVGLQVRISTAVSVLETSH